ncbi:MAG: crossover junction endodeoxyribonuclease RuvC [Chloroflexi bacterium]|nr:crossover junction endodeoxyribonuclease RuvC [Chloroflexota bacterium]OQB01017.1 MAG: Crossover junction endodeoxyribonuclease RuvC [Chloroflexi bacterium ADurb.Bin222]HQE98785.1 crossover junction endodeoxyribonuclease RuvC [Anaerolineae bacterium]HUM36085.1 crossover junction endodeoxyribonuclease RuvC [Anaerolineae bacterium]
MRALGVDPGTAITGYAIVEEDGAALQLVALGAIETPPKMPLPQRLQAIYTALRALIREHAPDAAAVEELFFSRNVTTAISVGQARGVVLLALAEAGLPTAEYTPLQVKQAVTGYGSADKHQVQEMVRVLLGLAETPRPDDAADAAAVAICHLHRARLESLLQP